VLETRVQPMFGTCRLSDLTLNEAVNLIEAQAEDDQAPLGDCVLRRAP
jgi:hypothetical protein